MRPSQRVKGAGRCRGSPPRSVPSAGRYDRLGPRETNLDQMVMGSNQRRIVAKATDVEKMVQGRWAK